MDFHITPIADIETTAVQETEVAALMFDALPEFYGALPCGMDETLAMIASQFAMPRTECHAPLIAQVGDKVVGAVAVYPTMDVAARQHESLMYIVRCLERSDRKTFRQALKSNGTTLASLDGHAGQYIARIAVTKASRGMGIGALLLNRIADCAQGQDLTLHVDRDNVGAIAFYQRHGFVFTNDTEARKLAMVRPNQAKGTFNRLLK